MRAAGRTGLLLSIACCAVGAEGPSTLTYQPTHKVRREDRHPMTAADFPGPDGVVYPDWRYAGVRGGIPDGLKIVARVEDFGAVAGDGRDDRPAFEKAVAAAVEAGGGVVSVGPGRFHLDRPLLITHDDIVLRGAGREKTEIVFRYCPPADGPVIHGAADGDTWDYGSWAQVHAAPDDLWGLELLVDGKVVQRRDRHAHWGGTFSMGIAIWKLLGELAPGEHKVAARALYGRKKRPRESDPLTIRFRRAAGDRAHRHGRPPYTGELGAITFAGSTSGRKPIELAATAERGDRTLTLKTVKGLAPGDAVILDAPATPRWNRLVRNACKWGVYRRYHFRIEKIDGRTVTLNQPLRLTFPATDAPTVRLVYPIRRCGVESLTLRQTRKLWTNGVFFSMAWNCWARDLRVVKAGRFPIYATDAKWIEFRDAVIDGAWYNGGGGTAYVGWQNCCDCLWDGLETFKMRHAPCLQWAASGCVIRNGVFHGSDAQWHAGWTNENLFENCRVIGDSQRWGGYGYGAWASPPGDTAHGPNGPRNVVYHCDITSSRSGVWLGGMNCGWIFVGNRLDVRRGSGFEIGPGSREHHIARNAIVLRKGKTAVVFRDAGATGVHLLDNDVYGAAELTGGPGAAAVAKGNALRDAPAAKAPPPARPKLTVRSIFEWQRRTRPLPKR